MKSPCVRLCTLNEEDLCLGCGRLVNEITSWSAYSDERRNEVMQECVRRLQMLEVPSLNLTSKKSKPTGSS